ncbi:hypothetical protein [Mechercharimyces sp. CAU 1602]|uniref:hypothetical protein n=1 Tax=Mechercharimyces sp. CAU 1602 TaxID=2973933 RepID=UPI002161EBB3|nr:hypothetical protein [Mechercharimyces sp. CAU 1602]MCS1351764.1 hypothetical protein [Mechercharimyces sp. CAU 1602]
MALLYTTGPIVANDLSEVPVEGPAILFKVMNSSPKDSNIARVRVRLLRLQSNQSKTLLFRDDVTIAAGRTAVCETTAPPELFPLAISDNPIFEAEVRIDIDGMEDFLAVNFAQLSITGTKGVFDRILQSELILKRPLNLMR